ncbi:hypothetical protein ASZ90_019393 [hydrocarbon metagenome]|uniref:Zn-ribbon domain-containing OB-fold protein n=1 Tax=hydrocarbon metagenome TaxID=938273 RepID=A0A0W8E3S2_9ZZZZ
MKDANEKWFKKGPDGLKIQYCPACEKYIFFPREICPYCLEVKPEWKETRGRGTIYSYTTVRRNSLPEFEDRVPYTYAMVELHEGIRIPSNIINCPVERVRIGMPVELAWIEESKDIIPVFRPAIP